MFAKMPGAAAADRRLLMEVEKGNLTAVTRLLGGGANVDGSRWLDLRPLISAARYGMFDAQAKLSRLLNINKWYRFWGWLVPN